MELLKLSFFTLLLLLTPALAAKKPYVVFLGSHSHASDVSEADFERVQNSHYELLGSFLGSVEEAKDAIFYSYKKHINGFAAVLEEEQAMQLAKHPEATVLPNGARELHTTHSWEFMNLEKQNSVHRSSLWTKANFGEGTIIGNLDTGVWPESKSFRDDGGLTGPIPSKWKGSCENNTANGVSCNKKLIGAKYYNKGYLAYLHSLNSSVDFSSVVNSTRDYEGHGSHTLSTAGGSYVKGASVYGSGYGTAKGGSPKAKVASYKVCWPQVEAGGCFDSDISKAFDDAIHDGVDVLSLSLGGEPVHYYEDSIAISSFHAIKKGVNVVCSAGNSGPELGTVSNSAPWILTVGASTLDREFQALVRLKNGKALLKGSSLSMPMRPKHKMYPLLSGAEAKASNASVQDAMLCKPGTLDHSKVKGKILACLRGETARVDKGEQAMLAGAVGMILCNDKLSGFEIIADLHVLPASHVNYEDGLTIFSYINSTKNPMGYILPPSAKLNTKPAPTMAAFSSRGPNTITPEIIKPDVTAPGVDVIAAYSEGISPTELPFDKRRVPFITMSGTSMSCPHVSGVVGLLKTLHPDWSPAAIKSAIMTSARTRDNTKHRMRDGGSSKLGGANPFGYGSGHIQPNKAMDPGLVYDLTTEDYLNFLCAIGYNQKMMRPFAGGPYKCPPSASLLDFNYPSIAVQKLDGNVTVTRKLKNVGSPGVYRARVERPDGVSVSVKPSVLKFSKIGEEKSFKVTLSGAVPRDRVDDGAVIWSDGKHFVRSTIVVSSGLF